MKSASFATGIKFVSSVSLSLALLLAVVPAHAADTTIPPTKVAVVNAGKVFSDIREKKDW